MTAIRPRIVARRELVVACSNLARPTFSLKSPKALKTALIYEGFGYIPFETGLIGFVDKVRDGNRVDSRKDFTVLADEVVSTAGNATCPEDGCIC